MDTPTEDLSARFGHPIRHVVFDWNGTLLDDARPMYDAWVFGADRFGFRAITFDEWQSRPKRPFRDYYDHLRQLANELPFSDEEYAQAGACWDQAYLELAAGVGLVPSAAELLTACASQNISTSICSIHYSWHVRETAEKLGVHDYFSIIRGREPGDVHETKAFYLKNLVAELTERDLITSPTEVLMVGDIQDDAKSAQEAGVNAALVASGEESASLLAQVGCPVFVDLTQFSEALLRSS